jgi:hypothetical protein
MRLVPSRLQIRREAGYVAPGESGATPTRESAGHGGSGCYIRNSQDVGLQKFPRAHPTSAAFQY